MKMPRLHTHLPTFVLLLVSLAALPGQSYVFACGGEECAEPEWVPLGSIWPGPSPVVPYWLSTSIPGNLPVSGQGDPALGPQHIHNGATMWSDHARSNLRFVFAGMTSVATVADDGVNAVIFRPVACPYAAGCLAACTVHASGGIIHGFDIEFFAYGPGSTTPLTWSLLNPGLGRRDVWGFAAHEFGHALGLGHSTVSAATMAQNASGFGQRSLEGDDILGIQTLYGVRPSSLPLGSAQVVGAGCGASTTPILSLGVEPILASSGLPFPLWFAVGFAPPNPAVSLGLWGSLGPPTPTSVGGGCVVQVNIAGTLGQDFFPWPELLLHLPSDPLLAGIQATFQHAWSSASGPVLSNAVTATVGF